MMKVCFCKNLQTIKAIVAIAEVMVDFTSSAGTIIEAVILVDEGQSVEVCVGVSGGTIVDREVVVHVATSDLDDEKPASK